MFRHIALAMMQRAESCAELLFTASKHPLRNHTPVRGWLAQAMKPGVRRCGLEAAAACGARGAGCNFICRPLCRRCAVVAASLRGDVPSAALAYGGGAQRCKFQSCKCSIEVNPVWEAPALNAASCLAGCWAAADAASQANVTDGCSDLFYTAQCS